MLIKIYICSLLWLDETQWRCIFLSPQQNAYVYITYFNIGMVSKIYNMFVCPLYFFRRYMAEILPIRRKTLSIQSIYQPLYFLHTPVRLQNSLWGTSKFDLWPLGGEDTLVCNTYCDTRRQSSWSSPRTHDIDTVSMYSNYIVLYTSVKKKKHIDASVKERPQTLLVFSEEICKRVLCNKHI